MRVRGNYLTRIAFTRLGFAIFFKMDAFFSQGPLLKRSRVKWPSEAKIDFIVFNHQTFVSCSEFVILV